MLRLISSCLLTYPHRKTLLPVHSEKFLRFIWWLTSIFTGYHFSKICHMMGSLSWKYLYKICHMFCILISGHAYWWVPYAVPDPYLSIKYKQSTNLSSTMQVATIGNRRHLPLLQSTPMNCAFRSYRLWLLFLSFFKIVFELLAYYPFKSKFTYHFCLTVFKH